LGLEYAGIWGALIVPKKKHHSTLGTWRYGGVVWWRARLGGLGGGGGNDVGRESDDYSSM